MTIIKKSGASGKNMKKGKKNQSLLLKVDGAFTPALVEDGEEFYPNGYFVFNITKMLRYIITHKDRFKISDISVPEYRRSMAIINEDHIDKVNIESPVILAEISPGKHNVIDGHHRIEKAYRMRKENIPGYILTPCQHMPFLTTVKVYHAYIEYWNNKVKEME